MTRKDFELIAAQIKGAYDRSGYVPYNERRYVLQGLAVRMAYEFAKTNPRFNRDRFLSACGVL